MDESKKELFKRVYSRQPLTMKFVMVLLAGFAVLVFSGVEQAIEWSDVTVWVFVFVLLATHIAYAVRFGRLIPCHEDFRSPFRLLLTGTVLWAVGAFVLYGCIHWDFRGEFLYVFFVVVAVFFGGVLAVILLVFCTKVNRADKEMVDRTIAEMNRGEMEECKLLNP